MLRSQYFLLALLFTVVLAGCSGGGILSPDVNYTTANARSAQYRTVIRGDTLFSIAWDIGVDFRTLAKWNNIRPPYLIKPGQRLRITPSTAKTGTKNKARTRARSRATRKSYRVKKGDTVYAIARKTGVSARQIIRLNRLRKPYRIRAGQRLTLSKQSTRTAHRRSTRSKARRSTRSRRSVTVATKPKSVGRWVWPTRGKILRRYTKTGNNKGLDIGGRAGTAILAAASGRVVYQGSGLRGYGKLIIIKHNSDYLSAYAHCASILVKEDSRVKRGQRIATMGKTGASRVKLHFEIRLRGNPVNPLRYLPSKS